MHTITVSHIESLKSFGFLFLYFISLLFLERTRKCKLKKAKKNIKVTHFLIKSFTVKERYAFHKQHTSDGSGFLVKAWRQVSSCNHKKQLINKGISMENLHGYDRILIISQTFRRYLSHLLIFCSSELRYKLKKVISFSADG